jgi:two-component system response regulator ChvI
MILISLAERPGSVKKRAQLMDACYEGNVYVSDRTIDSHVRNIRSKIRSVDEDAEPIKTVHGLGYKLSV